MSATLGASIKNSELLKEELKQNPAKFKVLTGERPTGQLHIGHLFGSINQRVNLQNLGVDTNIIIADYQVITDHDELGDIKNSVYGILADNIAAGLEPEKTIFFTHSQIPALNQLMLPFLALVTEAELHRNPTVKAENLQSRRNLSGLMLTYPVHQAADILFCKGNIVPVGKDQLPHIEDCRTIARRFNERFCGVKYGELDEEGQPKGIENAVFPEPQALLSENPHIPGLDGQKMSKSLGNTVMLSMTEDETAETIKKSPTDAVREISYNPKERPGVSALLTILALFRGIETGGVGENILSQEINSNPKYGAGLLKQLCIETVNEGLKEHRAKRSELMKDVEQLREILYKGNTQANEIANQTLKEVQNAMGTVY